MNASADVPGVLAVIIGRAGSKGLPGKNAMTVGGRPMVCHSIAAAAAAASVAETIVSTDCPHVAAAAAAMNVTVVARPPALADDAATVDDAVRHAVESTAYERELIVILYANVPVRPSGLIDNAVRMLHETGADSVQSYCDVGKHHPWWMVALGDDGAVVPHHPNRVYRRQDLPPLLIPDGGVIAVRRGSLMRVVEGEPHAFLGDDRRGIITAPGSVVDIDDRFDLAVAAAHLDLAVEAPT